MSFDLTDNMGIWYKALAMFLLLIFGSSAASYLIFGGEYSSYLVGSSLTALIVAIIAYSQKQRKQGQSMPNLYTFLTESSLVKVFSVIIFASVVIVALMLNGFTRAM